jgi:hypothetical protein
MGNQALSVRLLPKVNEMVAVMKTVLPFAILVFSVLTAGNPAGAAGCLGAAVEGAGGHYGPAPGRLQAR